MAIDKLDWLPLYWQRFIIGTTGMTAEEIGAYILLLIHQWDKGFIPEDPKELKRISKVSIKKLSKVLEKFEKIHGKLYNNTLEIIRIEQTEKHDKNTTRGKSGAKARWDKYKLSIAQASIKHEPSNSNREESREEEIRLEESREEATPPELNYKYQVGSEEILSVDEYFKEKFPIHLTNLKIMYGELKVKKWIEEFSNLHNQKTWKDDQDFRNHISNYFIIQEQNANKITGGRNNKGLSTTLKTSGSAGFGKL